MGMHFLISYLSVILLTHVHIISVQSGILYPRDSESREVKSLDGIWSFRLDGANGENHEQGFEEKWYEQPLFLVRR